MPFGNNLRPYTDNQISKMKINTWTNTNSNIETEEFRNQIRTWRESFEKSMRLQCKSTWAGRKSLPYADSPLFDGRMPVLICFESIKPPSLSMGISYTVIVSRATYLPIITEKPTYFIKLVIIFTATNLTTELRRILQQRLSSLQLYASKIHFSVFIRHI